MKRELLSLGSTVILVTSLVFAPSTSYAKTTSACEAEWKANKDTIQSGGKTKEAFISECRNEPQSAPGPWAPTPPRRFNQFISEAEAQAHCPGETVVWANTRSKIYHFRGSYHYGRTSNGAYMCEKDTPAALIRAPKNEMHPNAPLPK